MVAGQLVPEGVLPSTLRTQISALVTVGVRVKVVPGGYRLLTGCWEKLLATRVTVGAGSMPPPPVPVHRPLVRAHSADTLPSGAIASAEPASKVTLWFWLPGVDALVSVLVKVRVCCAAAVPMPSPTRANAAISERESDVIAESGAGKSGAILPCGR